MPGRPPFRIAPAASQAPSFEQLAIRLAAIGELAAAVNAALNLPSILTAVRRHARWLLDFVSCTLVVRDDQEPIYHVLGVPGHGTAAVTVRDLDTGWVGWVLAHGQTMVAPVDRDPVRFRQDQDVGAVGGPATTGVLARRPSRGRAVGVLVFGSNRPNAFDPVTLPIAQLIRLQVAAAVCNTRLMERLETAESVVMSLAHAVEAKDAYTEGHCRRLGEYGVRIAQALDLSGQELDAVYKGGMLHDIGKIAIPESILLKPGRLTDDEFKQMQQHVEAGVRICSPLRSLRASLPIIRHHHEHCNGTGYPDRLAAEHIPLLARIISVVDAYDAMTTTRPYRVGMSVTRRARSWKRIAVRSGILQSLACSSTSSGTRSPATRSPAHCQRADSVRTSGRGQATGSRRGVRYNEESGCYADGLPVVSTYAAFRYRVDGAGTALVESPHSTPCYVCLHGRITASSRCVVVRGRVARGCTNLCEGGRDHGIRDPPGHRRTCRSRGRWVGRL